MIWIGWKTVAVLKKCGSCPKEDDGSKPSFVAFHSPTLITLLVMAAHWFLLGEIMILDYCFVSRKHERATQYHVGA